MNIYYRLVSLVNRQWFRILVHEKTYFLN